MIKSIYFKSNTETVINDLDINDSLETSYQQISSKVQKWLIEGSGWLIESADDDYINIFVYNRLAGSSYM